MDSKNSKCIDTYELVKILGISSISALSAILLYKLFNEDEKALNRRLHRVQKRTQKIEKSDHPIRVWVDGCFDLMHFGHANAFRQARALGDYLVVGVNPESEIIKYKGPPIMSDDERCVAVSGCRWVDEVVPNVPYVLNEDDIKFYMEKYKIDYIVHGDDPCLTPEGKDVYAIAKREGKFKTIKRTEGVSTTDIVGRMLLMTRDHFRSSEISDNKHWEQASNIDGRGHKSNFIRHSDLLQTARRISLFLHPIKQPKPNDKIVYIDGGWDLFHAGHVELLRKAKEFGDFLIVGIHSDDIVNRIRGSNYPIMNLHERTLGVLSCRYVDEVIIGAPFKISQDMITTLNIQVVVHGTIRDSVFSEDPYELPRKMKILHQIQSPKTITAAQVVDRVVQNKTNFEKKFKKKNKSEEEYKANKTYVPEM